jgi:hypothetical protein
MARLGEDSSDSDHVHRTWVRKASVVSSGKVNRQQAALDNRVWPEDVVKVSNNITNQFEAPILFYVLCLLIFNINAAGAIALLLAWLYVPVRMRLFLLGCLILLAMLLLAVCPLAAAISPTMALSA